MQQDVDNIQARASNAHATKVPGNDHFKKDTD